MVAVERGAVPGVSAERGATRLGVSGDATFLLNDGIEGFAHRDFAANVANWLVDQSVLLSGLTPRPLHNYQISMTRRQLLTADWILVAVLPGGVLFIGALVWWRRRT